MVESKAQPKARPAHIRNNPCRAEPSIPSLGVRMLKSQEVAPCRLCQRHNEMIGRERANHSILHHRHELRLQRGGMCMNDPGINAFSHQPIEDCLHAVKSTWIE